MTLPFKQKDIYLGLAEISGLLRVTETVLEIEYKVKDTTLGLMDSSLKSCNLPIEIIEEIKIQKGWLSGKLTLEFNRMPDLDNPFQLESNILRLSIKKSDHEKAKTFRSQLMHRILDLKMDQMEEEGSIKEPESFSQTSSYRKRPQQSSTRKQTGDGGLENMLRDE